MKDKVIFDAGAITFKTDPMSNYFMLKTIEKKVNDRMVVKEVIYLNEIYDMLGILPTDEGQYIRWEKKDGEWLFFNLPEEREVFAHRDDGKYDAFILSFTQKPLED